MWRVGDAAFQPPTSASGPARSEFHFDAGGNQGGEGSDLAADWFIENVLEELDGAPPACT